MSDDPWKMEVQKLLGSIDAKMTRVLEDTKDHDKRLTTVEGKVHYWSGAGTIVGAVVGFFGQFFLKSHA